MPKCVVCNSHCYNFCNKCKKYHCFREKCPSAIMTAIRSIVPEPIVNIVEYIVDKVFDKEESIKDDTQNNIPQVETGEITCRPDNIEVVDVVNEEYLDKLRKNNEELKNIKSELENIIEEKKKIDEKLERDRSQKQIQLQLKEKELELKEALKTKKRLSDDAKWDRLHKGKTIKNKDK